MNLTTDEAKKVIGALLEDLSMVGEFLTTVASLPPEPLPGRPFPSKITKFVASLALGKAAIARMLIEKDEGARPSEVGMELIAKRKQIMNRKTEEFFALKHAIDDQVARLGWSKERCIVYIKDRYKVRSRLAMTDVQLKHLLQTLTNMATPPSVSRSDNKADRRRKRRRI